MDIILLIPNIRSTHNIGSIFRTAEGFGVSKIMLSGYTPYPDLKIVNTKDERLPHIRQKITTQISKTALGAEKIVPFIYTATLPIRELKRQGYSIIGLEQAKNSIPINEYNPPKNKKIALLIGEEVNGLTQDEIELCDAIIEIPMHGQKESFNVSVATGICLYALTLK